MDIERDRKVVDIWVFAILLLCVSFLSNYLSAARQIKTLVVIAPFIAGFLAFFFQLFVRRMPLIELYAKSYPYRKLKPYGVISTFLLFEFVLAWGLYTKQILPLGDDLFLITVIAIGAIVYYHLFVRMKISLRFFFLAIFIPLLAAGTALGLGSYFNIIEFIIPSKKIGDIVFINTFYWVLSAVFFQVICEEPAFRGYIMQRLIPKGEVVAIVYSSLAYAFWRLGFAVFIGMNYTDVLIIFCGNFIMGAIFAILFIKGRNLLVPIICHGIITGLQFSFFASSAHPGIRQYLSLLLPGSKALLMSLWFVCLLAGLILMTFIPRKKIYAS